MVTESRVHVLNLEMKMNTFVVWSREVPVVLIRTYTPLKAGRPRRYRFGKVIGDVLNADNWGPSLDTSYSELIFALGRDINQTLTPFHQG